MPPPRGKCVFNAELQKTYPYLKKQDVKGFKVKCLKCSSEFSVANSGKYDVENHIKSDKHRRAAYASTSSSTVTTFFKSATLDESTRQLAAIEGSWAYHTVAHNQSFRSTDCTSKLIQQCFEPKYSGARTKTEAIITGVLAPFSIEKLINSLSEVNFITISSDASNHNATKIIPIVVRFFTPIGVQVKVLEVKEQKGETSDIISNYIIETLAKYELTSKLLGISADNTNSNFGGASRRGTNNVFHKIKTTLNRPIIGIGCSAHIMNNCVKTAADGLPVDIEAAIVKIYSYFYIYTVRTEALKEFCEFVDVEYKKLLGYSATRWLALLPAVERILKLFPALKSYFASQEKCPVLIKNFLEDPVSELWLLFVHSVADSFHTIILKMEGQNISLLEVSKLYKDFQTKLIERRDKLFLPFVVNQLMLKLEGEGLINITFIKNTIKIFYSTCIDYLDQWGQNFTDMDQFQWVLLNRVPTYDQIAPCAQSVMEKFEHVKIVDTELFDEVSVLSRFVTQEMITNWKKNELQLQTKWVEVFDHFNKEDIPSKNIQILVEYCMCLSGTNASVERVFSNMNNFWTKDKSQLQVETLKSLLIVKNNFDYTCTEFYNMLKTNENLIKSIHSQAKYSFKNLSK